MSKLDELSAMLDSRGIEHVRANCCVFFKNCRVMEYVAARDSRPEHLNEPIMGLTLEMFNLTPTQVADALEVIASMTYPSAGYAVSAAIRLHDDGTHKASPSIEAKYHRMLEINDLLKRQQEEMRMLLERQDEEGEDA